MNTTYFISGHINITEDEFDEHYIPFILEAMKNKANFIIGDAGGVDKLSQVFLMEESYPIDKVTVYHMFTTPRNNAGFPTKGGFTSDNERDSAMTADSDFDIAWVRKGRETSGTAKNIKRRNNAKTKA